MKKILLLATSALLLLAGCAKETFTDPNGEGGLQNVTFTATMAGDATKAAVDGDGAAANVNRCIMEIYYGDALFTRMYSIVSDKKASFTTQLVANRTYTVAFWADHVESTSALETDLYYTTNAAQPDGGLQAISLAGTYAGNNDARDAFFHCDEYTIAQAGSAFNATLYRPFAQVNVITTDWDKVSSIASLKPDKVDVTIQSPLTKFNAVTGVASADANVTSLNYNADLYTAPAPVEPVSTTEKTLSMDYLFAATDKAVIDIAWKAQKTDNTDVSHSFSNIPYQRNYRTNIKGALLTTQGQWNVTVDPIWETPDTNVVIVSATVDDIDGMNTFVAEHSEAHQYDVTFSQVPSDAGVPSGDPEGAHSILTTPLGTGDVMNVSVETNTETLYVGDFENQNSTTLTSESTEAATVNINVPEGKMITTLVINAPSKSVYLNGQLVASAGTLTNVESTTSQNTLVVEAGQQICTLTVHQGGLEIHGIVQNLVISEDAHGTNPVKVRACENLSAEVFAVIKGDSPAAHNYIDTPYYVEQVNATDPETYDIVAADPVAQIGETKYWSIYDAVTAAQDGQTIELLKDITLTDWVLIQKSVNINLNEHTVTGAATGGTTHTDYCFTYCATGSANRISGKVYNGAINCKKVGVYAADYSDITVEDLAISQTTSAGSIPSYPQSAIAASDNATLLVKNGTYSADYAAAYVYNSGAYITVEDGTFSANLASGSYSIRVDGTQYNHTSYESVAELKDGKFYGPMLLAQNEEPSEYAAILAKGGVYSVDPATYVPFGYAKISNDDPETSSAYPWKVVTSPNFFVDANDSNLWHVANATGLCEFSAAVNAGNTFAGKTVQLDDTFTGDAARLSGEFTPIGTNSHPFSGIFDGRGKIIENVLINDSSIIETDGSNGGVGLFGKVTASSSIVSKVWDGSSLTPSAMSGLTSNDAVVKNVTIKNSTITCGKSIKNTGALVGYALNAYVADASIENTVVKGYKVIAGVVGGCSGSVLDNLSTDSNTTVGTQHSSGYHQGGILGWAWGTSVIMNCTNNATFTEPSNHGGYAGGIASYINDGAPSMLYNCTNNANLTIYAQYAAGIVGEGQGGGVYNNCVNNGAITATTDNKEVSGITSYAQSVTLVECENHGAITGCSDYAAGLISNCHSVSHSSSPYLNIVGINTNDGTVTNSKEGGKSGNITATVANSPVTYKNATYANVEQLNDCMVDVAYGTETVTIDESVNVTDKNGTFIIPGSQKFIASEVLSTNIDVKNCTSKHTIVIPNLHAEIGGSVPTAYLEFTGANQNITVADNANFNVIYVGNSVKGSTGSLTVNGAVTGSVAYAQGGTVTINSNGVIGGIDFHGNEHSIIVNNYGKLSYSTDTGGSHHVISNSHTSFKNEIVFNNYSTGTVELISPAYSEYLILDYQSLSMTLNLYDGSHMIRKNANGNGWIAITQRAEYDFDTQTNINYQSGAIFNNNGTETNVPPFGSSTSTNPSGYKRTLTVQQMQ